MMTFVQKLSPILFIALIINQLYAQNTSLVNTSQSPFAKLRAVEMDAVRFSNSGFWGERLAICQQTMVPQLWQTYTDPVACHSFRNFEIAAGLESGNFRGPSFHDGDFYKTIEAVASMYARTKDSKLDELLDQAIAVIAKAQQPDGYIYTKAIIKQKQTGESKMFDDKLSFEAYNFGHLMTAACVHHRATGKNSLLDVAKKATNFLMNFYQKATPEQARNAICPSHYMGIVEMYRTTHKSEYLTLANKLIDIRGLSEGSDDNSDRLPFRMMTQVQGHAVRANYLFAGVADVFAETGDSTLLRTLDLMWNDVVNRKMYVTGGCGALYDGVSPAGTSYKPDSIQKIQQAYGKAYELPSHSAHNETCANIGHLLWNWRMLQITGNAKYADIVELELYNGILSGVSLAGDKFFYSNPLRVSGAYPYKLRWAGGRQKYIRISNCCPPNTVRTIAEVSNYMYSLSERGLYVNLYGENTLSTHLKNGKTLTLSQQTNYPWNGAITLNVNKIVSEAFSFFLRIPGWCVGAQLKINGKPSALTLVAGQYTEIRQRWKKGDKIELSLPMPVTLIESNPLVEETRNQVAVKRGPLVYCAESNDQPNSLKITNVSIPITTQWTLLSQKIENSNLIMLEGKVKKITDNNWTNQLYKPIIKNKVETTILRLIPYYAWANRGQSDMSVWLPLSR